MAIFKSINSPSSAVGGSNKALNYVDKKSELTKGVLCSDNGGEAYKDFQDTKKLHRKMEGRQYKHYVLSFDKNEGSKEIAIDMAEKIAKEKFSGHEVFIAVHTDTKNTHCHMVVNSVSLETGKKFQQSFQDLKEYKEYINTIGKEHKIEISKKEKIIGNIKTNGKDKRKIIEKHLKGKEQSDIVTTYKALTDVLGASNLKSKEELSKELKKKDIELIWKDTRKNITLELGEKTATGKKTKFRLSNLEKTFGDKRLSKENLQQIFQKSKELEKSKQQFLTKKKEKNRGFER